MLNGYREAEKIDQQLNSLTMKYIIDKENAREWLALTRTITSTLHTIQYEAYRVMSLKEN